MNTIMKGGGEIKTNTNKRRVRSMLKEGIWLGGGPTERLKGEYYK
jgi:hypothetical protein